MRYLVGFVFVLAALVASPLSAGAQTGQEGTDSEPNLQEPAPSSEPAPEEPALQLQLDDAGVEVAPSLPRTPDGYPRTPDGYTLGEMERRVWRAKIGISASAVGVIIGMVVVGASASAQVNDIGTNDPRSVKPAYIAGGILFVGSSLGLIASGVLLGVHKRKLRRLQEAHYGRPHRVQWDLTQSRLVF